MASGDENTPSAMWSAVLLITLQSFLFGYCFSSLNPCLVTGDSTSGSACFHGTDSGCPKGTIYNDLNLSTIEAQTATSLTVAAAWIGCMIGSYPSERYGRKITLLANNLFFIAGSAIAASGSLPALFVGRTIIGFGVGICSVVPPVLLSEISSQATRGMFTTFHQLMLTLAIFTVNIIGFGLVTYVNHGWQYVQGLAIVPAVIMLVMHSYIPESPKWLIAQYSADTNGSAGVGSGNPLIHHGDDSIATPEFHQSSAVAKTTSFGSNASDVQHPFFQQAKSTLVRLRGVEVDVSEELNGLLQEVSGDKNADRNVSWAEVFACKEAMVIGCGLLFFQAFTGINTVVFYSTTIFGLAGFKDSIIGSACWSFVNFLMTGVAARLIDSAGRRILLLRGTYVMLGALVLLAAILLADVQAKTQGDIAVLAVLIYVCGYAVSLGAVPWTIISEIMPTRQRMKAVSLFLSINWGANLLIGLLTLTAIDSLGGVKKSMTDDETAAAETKGVGYLYLIFGVVTACCVLFITFFVPETKGKSPEQLNKPLLQGVDGRGTEESDYLVAPRSTSGQKQYI